MSSALRKAAEQAREALNMMLNEYGETNCPASDHADAAITALRAALDWPDVTITGTYKEFIEFVRMACMHETIYEDSEGRDILVIRVLDAYGMAHSWALEHARHNFP